MCAHLILSALARFRSFVGDGWNIFDICVVSLSLVALGPIPMPINVVRSVRAFRVLRFFGRVGALRDIISALTAAVLPVLNAFLVLFIVAAICKSPPEYIRVSSCVCLTGLPLPTPSQMLSSAPTSSPTRRRTTSAASTWLWWPCSESRPEWAGLSPFRGPGRMVRSSMQMWRL